MKQLQQLIHDYCPNGVPYLKLGDIATDIYRGSGITRSQVGPAGTPCVRYGEIYTTYGIWFDHCVSFVDASELRQPKYFGPGDILFAITGENVDDIAKSTAYVGNQQCLAGGDIVVLKHRQNPKYLSYALATSDARRQKSKGRVKNKAVHSNVPAIKEIVVPIPPLRVQEEIVRVLDRLSLCTADLSDALASEIACTTELYQHYRDNLLSFDPLDHKSKFGLRRLGEVCDLKAGKAIPSEQISSQKDVARPVPCFGGNGLRGYVQNANQHGDKSLIGRQGALCGNVCYATGEYYATEHAIVVTDMGHYDPRFLYHMLACLNLNQYKTAGAQPGLSVRRLKEVLVPVPSMPVQKRIAGVLDKLEPFCADLANTLRSEISMRQKQYEYYRDKLLAFKELEA